MLRVLQVCDLPVLRSNMFLELQGFAFGSCGQLPRLRLPVRCSKLGIVQLRRQPLNGKLLYGDTGSI